MYTPPKWRTSWEVRSGRGHVPRLLTLPWAQESPPAPPRSPPPPRSAPKEPTLYNSMLTLGWYRLQISIYACAKPHLLRAKPQTLRRGGARGGDRKRLWFSAAVLIVGVRMISMLSARGWSRWCGPREGECWGILCCHWWLRVSNCSWVIVLQASFLVSMS